MPLLCRATTQQAVGSSSRLLGAMTQRVQSRLAWQHRRRRGNSRTARMRRRCTPSYRLFTASAYWVRRARAAGNEHQVGLQSGRSTSPVSVALSRSGLLDSSPARLSPVRSALRYFKLVPLTSTFRSNPSRCSDFKSNVKLNQTRVHTGEASKFVAVSAVRFSVLEISASALSVRVAGSPGETVQVGGLCTCPREARSRQHPRGRGAAIVPQALAPGRLLLHPRLHVRRLPAAPPRL